MNGGKRRRADGEMKCSVVGEKVAVTRKEMGWRLNGEDGGMNREMGGGVGRGELLKVRGERRRWCGGSRSWTKEEEQWR